MPKPAYSVNLSDLKLTLLTYVEPKLQIQIQIKAYMALIANVITQWRLTKHT